MYRFLSALALPLLLIAIVACGDDGDANGNGSTPRVVASTALIGEFASIVAGEDAEVSVLIPAGVDIHSYEPSPASAASVADADIVFVNGYNLEETLLDLVFENVADDVEIVPVAAGLAALDGGHDDEDHDDGEADEEHDDGDLARASGDPHMWLDVENAIHYVEQIRDQLAELDAERADAYRDRAGAYIVELEALDAEVAEAVASIPEDSRELVVFHDAYQYFAAAYGLELSAAVLPAGAQQDPSAQDVVEIVELVRERSIPAIFREPQFSASVVESIAEETGATVLLIYSTYAGDVDTYIELMRANANAVRTGLEG